MTDRFTHPQARIDELEAALAESELRVKALRDWYMGRGFHPWEIDRAYVEAGLSPETHHAEAAAMTASQSEGV